MIANLPTDIKDLAKEIQASLAAEDPINTAYRHAERDAYVRYQEATSLARAELTKVRDELAKADREATAAFETIDIPASKVRDAATKRAARVRQKELDAVRIQTGHLLLAAKKKVDKGGWQAWCKANVKRSQSDIRMMIALAESSDPVAAREAEKANTRARVQRHRASAVTSAPVTAVTLSPAMVEQAPLAVRPSPQSSCGPFALPHAGFIAVGRAEAGEWKHEAYVWPSSEHDGHFHVLSIQYNPDGTGEKVCTNRPVQGDFVVRVLEYRGDIPADSPSWETIEGDAAVLDRMHHEKIAQAADPAATQRQPPPTASPSPREQFEAERDAKVAGIVLEIQKLTASERLAFWGRCAERWHQEIADSLMNDLQVNADRLGI
jgi:hypothetical protein